jgi:hypothetical protein
MELNDLSVFVKVYSYKNVPGINYFRNFHTVFGQKNLVILNCNHRNQSTSGEVLLKVSVDFNVVGLRRVILGP